MRILQSKQNAPHFILCFGRSTLERHSPVFFTMLDTLVLFFVIGIFISWCLIRIKQLPIDVSQNVLFLTAHPDDELMFFGPTLLSEIRARTRLHNSTSKVHLLCLSQGDFYGDGHRRGEELADACLHLCGNSKRQQEVDVFRLKVLNDEHLPDSPGVNWPAEAVLKHVNDYIGAHQITKVITFDASGVSSHPNHVAIHRALCQLKQTSSLTGVELWQLQSLPLWRKYLSWLDVLLTLAEQESTDRRLQIHLLTPGEYLHIFNSLRRHRSQMLWFRYLYAFTSRYMLINSLTELE